MGPLIRGILDLMDDVRKELSAPEDRWDLFAVANYVFLKWGKTHMDDDGDTQMVIAEVTDAWDHELYEEYQVTFSDDQWHEETEQSLYPAVVGRYNAMSFFEKEKPFDLMMSTLYILLKAAD